MKSQSEENSMSVLPSDLALILRQALQRVGTANRVWVRKSDSEESSIEFRNGVLLGACWSERFLKNEVSETDSSITGIEISSPNIVCVDSIPLNPMWPYDWSLLLENMARSKNGLLIVTDSFESWDFVSTLVLDSNRGILASAIVKSREQRVPWLWTCKREILSLGAHM